MRRIRKAVGALLGGVTAGAVLSVAAAFGVEVSPELAGAVAVLLAALGTYLAPANEEPAAG